MNLASFACLIRLLEYFGLDNLVIDFVVDGKTFVIPLFGLVKNEFDGDGVWLADLQCGAGPIYGNGGE